jgi:hypothetical protein
MKPYVKLQGYDSTKYNVLVALKSGTVYVASSYSYKAAAYRMAHQRSPSMDPRTYRCLVLRPGGSLLNAVNWLIEGLQENSNDNH